MRYLLLVVFLTGCPDNVGPIGNNLPSDSGNNGLRDAITPTDARFDVSDLPQVDGAYVRTPQQDGVTPDGHSDVESPTGPTVARAGRLQTDGGFKGIWAHCKPDDFKLYNNVVEFCIQGVETNRYEFFRGGILVDAKRLGDSAEDEFDVLTFRKDLTVFNAESVYVVRDGSDGRTAVIRADGVDMPIAHFVGALGAAPFRWGELKWSVEYRLRPDSDVLEIATWLTKANGLPQANIDAGDLVGFGDRFRIWTQNSGFETEMISNTNFVVGFNDHQSFAWVSPEPNNQFSIPFGDVPWFLGREVDVNLPENGEWAKVRWLVLGEDLESLHTRRDELIGTDFPKEQQAVFRHANGSPLVGAVIEVLDGTGSPFAITRTDAAGVIRFQGEQGTYGFQLPTAVGGQETIETAEVPTEIVVSEPGTLDVTVEIGGQPATAMVRLTNASTNYDYVVDHNNPVPIEVAPGQYRITVNKGMAYDFLAADITISVGQATKVVVSLNEVVDTTNYIGADFHQHLEPSIDSNISIEQRILDNVAQGLDFVTPTDHEVVTDLQPYIDGLGAVLSTMPGIEVSPVTTHFNLFPMVYQKEERARGSIPLAVLTDNVPTQRTIPEMMQLARDHSSNPVIQINHGRRNSGFFTTVEHDPSTNPLLNPHAKYSPEYDAMEVINEWDTACELFTDWASHLNVGRLITATGNSDSHSIWGQAGYPRNYLYIPGASAGNTTNQQVVDAMLNHRVTVAGNVFVELTDGKLPGDMVTVTPNVAEDFAIRVQTPPFAVAEKIVVVVNGVAVDEIDISGNDPTAIIDFDGVIQVTTAVDAWVTFVALGPRVSAEVHNGRRVMGFVNALILDADGNGVFTPPGPLSMDLIPAFNTFSICQ